MTAPTSFDERAPCVECVRETSHELLHALSMPPTTAAHNEGRFETLRCRGCGRISFRETWTSNRDRKPYEVIHYPPAISRRRPEWASSSFIMAITYDGTEKFFELLEEIYIATQNNLPRLAIMGIRSLLEHIMIDKVTDQGTFLKNIDAFQEGGYISLIQRDALREILEAGHAVSHRGYIPNKQQLNTALDVMEGIIAAIYVHDHDIKELNIPERPKRPKKEI